MKINTVEITNFKGIYKQTIQLEKVNVFLGKCGSGKTSILQAVKFALTGKADADVIRKGTENASVLLTMENGSTLERTRNEKGTVTKVNGKKTTAVSADTWLKENFGIHAEDFETMYTESVLSLDKRDMTELLLKSLPVKIDLKHLLILMNQISPVNEQVKTRMSEKFDGVFGLSRIDEVYAEFYKERREQKSKVETLRARVKAMPEVPSRSEESLKMEWESLAKQELSVRQYAEKKQAVERAKTQYAQVVAKRNQLLSDLERIKEIPNYSAERFEKAEKERMQFYDAVNKGAETIGLIQNNLRLFRDMQGNLNTNVCPITRMLDASVQIQCTTDKSVFSEKLKNTILQNEEALKKWEVYITRCKAEITKRDQILTEEQNRQKTNAMRNTMQKALDSLLVPEIPQMPEEVPIPSADEKTAVYAQLSVWNTIRTLKAEEANLKQEESVLEVLNTCLKLLDAKSGVKTVILHHALRPFEKTCNEKAASLRKGFSIAFSCTDGITVMVRPRETSDWVPMKQLSSGELLFTCYLIIHVLNQLNGSKILLIDSLDRFDAEIAEQFMKLIKSDDSFDHILIASVDHTDVKRQMDSYEIMQNGKIA